MQEPVTYHLSMTGPNQELVYHLQCDSLAQAFELAQGNRGPEAVAITDSTRQCHACRAWGVRKPLALHASPHGSPQERGEATPGRP